MCIRDSLLPLAADERRRAAYTAWESYNEPVPNNAEQMKRCLLYTSDAADERSSVDLGGRRIIKKKKHTQKTRRQISHQTATI